MATPITQAWEQSTGDRSIGLTITLNEQKRITIPYMHLLHVIKRGKDIAVTFSCAEVIIQCTHDFPIDGLLNDLDDQHVKRLSNNAELGLRIEVLLIAGEDKVPL